MNLRRAPVDYRVEIHSTREGLIGSFRMQMYCLHRLLMLLGARGDLPSKKRERINPGKHFPDNRPTFKECRFSCIVTKVWGICA